MSDSRLPWLIAEESRSRSALQRMLVKRWVVAEWRISANNRRARFYRLTTAGKKQLASSREYWSRFAGAVYKVLETAPSARCRSETVFDPQQTRASVDTA